MSGLATKSDAHITTVRIPFSVRKRGGRKYIVAPEGAPPWAPRHDHVDSTLVKAIARAFRWRKLLDTEVFVTVSEIAAAEKINKSYVSRVLRLTLLAPDLVEAILDGRHDRNVITLKRLLEPFPLEWENQRAFLHRATS